MSKFATAARRFLRDETGATMAEYALLVAVIALVAVAAARNLGDSVRDRLGGAAQTIWSSGY